MHALCMRASHVVQARGHIIIIIRGLSDISNNAAVKEQLVVHERALATLRNLTTLPSFCHELESIDFGGVDILKLFIDWCLVWDEESSSLYASFGHLVVDDSDAAAAFDSLAVGKELVGRVLNRCQDDDDGILVDLFDMSDDDDEEARLCEILLESGHFERSFFDIDERGFNSFWANVIVDGETFDDGQFRAVVSQIKEGENGCRYSVPLRDKGEVRNSRNRETNVIRIRDFCRRCSVV